MDTKAMDVIKYAYKHDYEPNEAINLLRSKGMVKISEAQVKQLYSSWGGQDDDFYVD